MPHRPPTLLPVSDPLHFLWQLVDTIPSPIFWKDASGLYLGCNTAFEQYIGITRETLIGKSVFDIAPGDLAEVYAKADQALLDSRDTQIYEAEVRYADGSRHTVMFHKGAFTLPDNSVGGLVGVMLDITDRRRAEEALRLSATVFERSSQGITVTDSQGRILRANKAFQAITGYNEKEALGRTPGELLNSGTHPKEFFEQLWSALRDQGHWFGEIVNRRKSGELYCEHLSITRVNDNKGNPINYIGVFSDLTEAKTASSTIEQLSYFDRLTGLPNRVLLVEHLESILKESASNRGAALIIIYVSGLAHVNDALGHHEGDKLLVDASQRLLLSLPTNAALYRHSGNAYSVLLKDEGDEAAVRELAKKILGVLRQPFWIDRHPVSVTPHVGIALSPQDGATPADLIRNTEVALHVAQESETGTPEFFHEDMNRAALKRMQIEAGLRLGLTQQQFVVHYQPQVDCRSGKIIGMEALVRWHHPEMGMVSPVQFIPIAEANGFIIELGDWVLREACRTTWKLHDEGHSDLKVAVNVSARQFAEQGFVDRVKSALTDTGLPARFLELELTESLIMENPNRVEGVMSELKALGITFSIDDFGTGYSSLSHLTRFPLDKLKIDRSFILDITERKRRSVITEAIIGLARNLHLQVIAEGVESQVQQQFLSENGCHFIQGFLFSRPLSAPQIQELLARYPYEHFPGTPAGSA